MKFIWNRDLDLKFEVWNVNDNSEGSRDLIGEVLIKLSDIVKDKNQEQLLVLSLPLRDNMTKKEI